MTKFSLLCAFLIICNVYCYGFSPLKHTIRSSTSSSLKSTSSGNNNDKAATKTFSKLISAGVIAASLMGPPAAILIPTQPAYADVRAQQKRTYFRFVPRLITGRDFYKNELKQAVEKEDWDVITKFFDTFVVKVNPNDPTQIDQTDTFANQNYFRPMTVLAGSFAERATSPKQKALVEQEVAFEQAMNLLEGTVKERKGEGFFAPSIKIPTGAERKQQAVEAYKAGKEALNSFITIANDGLMLELNKIDTI